MQRFHTLNRLRFAGAAVFISAILLGMGIVPTAAQTALPPVTISNPSDPGAFPLYLDLTGTIDALSPTSIVVDNFSILLTSAFVLPAGIGIGAYVTVHAQLVNDDQVIAISVEQAFPLATLTPALTPAPVTATPAVVLATATPIIIIVTATAPPPVSTPVIVGTPPVIKGCGLPKAIAAIYLAQAYGIPLEEMEFWHCNGNAYGVIARAYAIVYASDDESVTVARVLELVRQGKSWAEIEALFKVNPDKKPIKVDGGKVTGKGCPPGQAKKGKCGPGDGQGNDHGDKDKKKDDKKKDDNKKGDD
jgi:hypothetical protein